MGKPRNEIIEQGQHIGLTGSGCLWHQFSEVGKIVGISKNDGYRPDRFVGVDIIKEGSNRIQHWFCVSPLSFQLYEDEVLNGVKTK